jgi:XTP/dITP diphosphohydrolase
MSLVERPRLVLATNNHGKLVEFRALLPPEVEVLSAAEAGLTLPAETGSTFIENARLKAVAAAKQAQSIALADDSGLEVDALDGQPGIHSARYAGPACDERANRRRLLAAMAAVPSTQRGARFRCAVSIATPNGAVFDFEGTCEGSIGFEEVGTNGFGYDPLFVLPDGRTMAQLSTDEKNAISHRARAYHAALPLLLTLLGLTKDAGT